MPSGNGNLDLAGFKVDRIGLNCLSRFEPQLSCRAPENPTVSQGQGRTRARKNLMQQFTLPAGGSRQPRSGDLCMEPSDLKSSRKLSDCLNRNASVRVPRIDPEPSAFQILSHRSFNFSEGLGQMHEVISDGGFDSFELGQNLVANPVPQVLWTLVRGVLTPLDVVVT